MSKFNKILFTGSTGRFGKIFKKLHKEKKYLYPTRKKLDINNTLSVKKYFKKNKPNLVIHCAALSRPMDIHEKKIEKSIITNIIGTSNLVVECIKKKLRLSTCLQIMFIQELKEIIMRALI